MVSEINRRDGPVAVMLADLYLMSASAKLFELLRLNSVAKLITYEAEGD